MIFASRKQLASRPQETEPSSPSSVTSNVSAGAACADDVAGGSAVPPMAALPPFPGPGLMALEAQSDDELLGLAASQSHPRVAQCPMECEAGCAGG